MSNRTDSRPSQQAARSPRPRRTMAPRCVKVCVQAPPQSVRKDDAKPWCPGHGARGSPRARLAAGVVPSATCSRKILNRRASTEKRQRPRLSALHRWNNQSSSLHVGARVAATSVAGSRVGEKCCAAIFSQKAVFRPPVADKVDVRLNASI